MSGEPLIVDLASGDPAVEAGAPIEEGEGEQLSDFSSVLSCLSDTGPDPLWYYCDHGVYEAVIIDHRVEGALFAVVPGAIAASELAGSSEIVADGGFGPSASVRVPLVSVQGRPLASAIVVLVIDIGLDLLDLFARAGTRRLDDACRFDSTGRGRSLHIPSLLRSTADWMTTTPSIDRLAVFAPDVQQFSIPFGTADESAPDPSAHRRPPALRRGGAPLRGRGTGRGAGRSTAPAIVDPSAEVLRLQTENLRLQQQDSKVVSLKKKCL